MLILHVCHFPSGLLSVSMVQSISVVAMADSTACVLRVCVCSRLPVCVYTRVHPHACLRACMYIACVCGLLILAYDHDSGVWREYLRCFHRYRR